MAIVPNTIKLPLALQADFIADTLAELTSQAASYVDSYVLVSEFGKIYRVSYDASVNYTKLDIVPASTEPGVGVYIQPDQPVVSPGTKYLWIKTGLGVNHDQFDILVSLDGT